MKIVEESVLEIGAECGFLNPLDLLEFGHKLIARIDAKRGNAAFAWASRDHEDLAWSPREYFTIPLFAIPTTPEGMALVPIEPTEEMIKAGAYENGYQAVSRHLVLAVWKDMIAAQGERNV